MSHHLRLAGSFAVAGLVSLSAIFWFSPVKSGETRPSPDSKFTASAFNSSRGTLRRGRVHYIELQVVESATNRKIWKTEIHSQDQNKVPDYSLRQEKPFVFWAQDSTSVTFPVGLAQPVTLPVQ